MSDVRVKIGAVMLILAPKSKRHGLANGVQGLTVDQDRIVDRARLADYGRAADLAVASRFYLGYRTDFLKTERHGPRWWWRTGVIVSIVAALLVLLLMAFLRVLSGQSPVGSPW